MKTPTPIRPSTSGSPDREKFFSRIRPHLETVREFVGHQIAYREALGDLIKGELTPEDVVDAILVRAYETSPKDGPSVPPEEIGTWLTGLAERHLAKEVKRLKTWRNRTVKIEEDVPETPPAQEVSTLGDEILDFYEPDEDWKLEDVIPDIKVPTPEEEAERTELQRCVKRAISSMPRDWRRALSLRHVSGLTGQALGDAMGRSASEAEDVLHRATQQLRQKLVDSGFRFNPYA